MPQTLPVPAAPASMPSTVAGAENPPGAQRKDAAAGGDLLPPEERRAAADRQEVEAAVSRISDFVQNFQRDLQFSVDKESGRTVIKVVDSETEEVIRQIPSEETLRLAARLDSPDALMLNEKA
ncbi:MAG TPA: flagellar protein FlaG [Gammaproteobacteria bacterium]|nr:flagellar protein FlaG [Gammaproteobacteria bacterium]